MELNNLFILNILNSGISLIMSFYMLFLQRNSYKLGTGYWGAGALIIKDTGDGIQPEKINSLFRFESSRSDTGTNGEIGSGLGLVLCKELASRMDGAIEIESQIGVGTKVFVTFPSAEHVNSDQQSRIP